jgi:hypothetical protein
VVLVLNNTAHCRIFIAQMAALGRPLLEPNEDPHTVDVDRAERVARDWFHSLWLGLCVRQALDPMEQH